MKMVSEKIATLSSSLQEAVAQYNRMIEESGRLREEVIAMSGALKALQELESEQSEDALVE